MFDLKEHSHRRLNPLTGEWLVVSPHRTKRPWQGQVEPAERPDLPSYDPECYLCPGNKRAADKGNPKYNGVFVFDNDFAALMPDVPEERKDIDDLLVWEQERGICRVVCFLPDHSLTLSRMDVADIKNVVDEWARQFVDLGDKPFISHVQIFENRGAMMGASNPHPHCQIWASESIPNEPVKEIRCQQSYKEVHESCLLCDYLKIERKSGERVVFENEHFTALVPFWAVYPFEVMILGHRHCDSLDDLSDEERLAYADVLKRLTTRYDNLFLTSFPYSMGLHQRPTNGGDYSFTHFHTHFYPPLLRSATVRKFLVGFEILGSPQRDITPESAAERLRDLSEIHYLETE
jgi:UDPglucose--hexose-1-phosphate uridylyltransferase